MNTQFAKTKTKKQHFKNAVFFVFANCVFIFLGVFYLYPIRWFPGSFAKSYMFLGVSSRAVSCHDYHRKFSGWEEEYIEHRGFGIKCVPNIQIRCNNASVLALALRRLLRFCLHLALLTLSLRWRAPHLRRPFPLLFSRRTSPGTVLVEHFDGFV